MPLVESNGPDDGECSVSLPNGDFIIFMKLESLQLTEGSSSFTAQFTLYARNAVSSTAVPTAEAAAAAAAAAVAAQRRCLHLTRAYTHA